jgi:hypothetical protein
MTLVLAFYTLLIVAWTGAWLLYRSIGLASRSSDVQTLYWTAAKLLIWLVPIFAILSDRRGDRSWNTSRSNGSSAGRRPAHRSLLSGDDGRDVAAVFTLHGGHPLLCGSACSRVVPKACHRPCPDVCGGAPSARRSKVTSRCSGPRSTALSR